MMSLVLKETFFILKKYNMHLDVLKCTFGAELDKILELLFTLEEI